MLLGDVKQDRSGFEELHLAVAERRDLLERLPLHVILGPRIGGAELFGGVWPADFLERPAHAQIAHQAFGEVGNPVERGDDGGGLSSHGINPLLE